LEGIEGEKEGVDVHGVLEGVASDREGIRLGGFAGFGSVE
jgi:hypothetical protein